MEVIHNAQTPTVKPPLQWCKMMSLVLGSSPLVSQIITVTSSAIGKFPRYDGIAVFSPIIRSLERVYTSKEV